MSQIIMKAKLHGQGGRQLKTGFVRAGFSEINRFLPVHDRGACGAHRHNFGCQLENTITPCPRSQSSMTATKLKIQHSV